MLTKAVIVVASLVAATTAGFAGLSGAVSFTSSIGLGSVLVAMLITILAGAANLRSRLLKDQIDGWKGNYEQTREHCARLEEELAEVKADLAAAKLVIQRLEQLPNLERLVRLMVETQEKQQAFVLQLHQENIAAHEATLTAIKQAA